MTRKRLTLREVAEHSASDLIDAYGSEVLEQLSDLAAAAVWKGDDAGAVLIDTRLREVEAVLGL